MKKQFDSPGAALAVLAMALLLGVASTPSLAAGVVVKADADNSIGLTNLDGPDEDPSPAAAATPPAAVTAAGGAAATEKADQSAANTANTADKPDPLTQHRSEMLQQAKPENYMNSNPATSRRYLMVDKQTYQSRLKQ